ncbi:PH domain-containing protein [Pedobacter sp. SL55]|uniref:PH domain-containing protein n=1 Tax=Pedobacter sp. SL55 TaxID=2995161 RepID=UPI002271CB02|nr:PH domain-containing protein [Pedobacter sp. SL55]WAC40669.1 PH domain-containing protein [Pedobacter sp. SL55]
MQHFTNETIDLNALPKYEATKFTNPDQKYWNIMVINLTLFLLLIGIGLALIIFFNEDAQHNWMIWTSLYLVLATSLFLVFRASFKRRGFALREKDVLYKSGIIAETTTVIPLNRIQHVALNEGLLSRMFQLGTLHIYTAGGSSGEIRIAGVPIEQAKAIKEALAQSLVEIRKTTAE